jgi:pimeloyl-ACP methyl ester carboxylesterase
VSLAIVLATASAHQRRQKRMLLSEAVHATNDLRPGSLRPRTLTTLNGARLTMKQAVVVFVHGLFSSGQIWSTFRGLMVSDSDLADLELLDFEYPSPKFSLNPLRRIPDFDVLADSLRTYLETEAADYSDVILVSHSQGGLIVQRYLARTVMGGRGNDLRRIRRVVMFACPNSGSELFLAARRRIPFWSHPQERELRPIHESVSATQQVVINRIVHAQRTSSDQCGVPVHVYAGEQDNVVTPTSAKGVFPDTGVLPGDHSTIIQPDSTRHRSYLALKGILLGAVSAPIPQRGPAGLSFAERDKIPNPGPSDGSAESTKIYSSDLSPGVDESTVIAKWNPTSRTLDFILTPETALAWIRQLGEEKSSDD